jgi:hypothetical protein
MNTTSAFLIFIAAVLLLVRVKGWVSESLFKHVVDVATIIAAVAAIMTFDAPTSQDSKPTNKPDVSISLPQEATKPNTQDIHPIESYPTQLPKLSDEPPVNKKNGLIEEEKHVGKGKTEQFIDKEITVSLEDISVDDRVYATIGSHRAPNQPVKGKKVGFVSTYESDGNEYKVRITGVDYFGRDVQFAVAKQPKPQLKAQPRPLPKPQSRNNPVATSSVGKPEGDYYLDVVYVNANDAGSIFLKGHEQLSKLIQFCPDDSAESCGPSIEITRKGDVFKLNKDALARHQKAFNFQDANGLWLQIRNNNVVAGSNLIVERGLKKKSYFVYQGPVIK